MLKFSLHFAEGRAGICQDMHAAEAQMPCVPHHVEEGNGTRPALRSKHEITGPGIICNVALSAIPNVEAIQRVIENGQPDSKQLQIKDKRKAGRKFYLFGERSRTTRRKRIGDEVLDAQTPARNNAAELVQAPEPQRGTLSRAKRTD